MHCIAVVFNFFHRHIVFAFYLTEACDRIQFNDDLLSTRRSELFKTQIAAEDKKQIWSNPVNTTN